MLSNGVVECDTIEELRKLQSRRPTQKPRSVDRTKPTAPKAIELTEPTKLFLNALLKSTSGLNTDQLALELGIGAKSLPPVLRTLKKWCERKKLDFEGLINRRPGYVNKRYVTTYSLTDQGRVKFASLVGTLAANGKEGTVNSS